jgi:hypothetical protein
VRTAVRPAVPCVWSGARGGVLAVVWATVVAEDGWAGGAARRLGVKRAASRSILIASAVVSGDESESSQISLGRGCSQPAI